LLADPETPEGSDPRRAYSKLASSQAGLFLARNLMAEAEGAFRVATEICPASPEAVYGWVNLLVEQKRFPEAQRIADNAISAAPDNKAFSDLVAQLRGMSSK
jgi:hypothetical protein